MKYKLKIEGMHCTSCATLIGMDFEEKGLKRYSISQSDSIATFESEESILTVKKLLDEIFAIDSQYSYTDLGIVSAW